MDKIGLWSPETTLSPTELHACIQTNSTLYLNTKELWVSFLNPGTPTATRKKKTSPSKATLMQKVNFTSLPVKVTTVPTGGAESLPPDPTSLPNGAKSQSDPTSLPNGLKPQPDPTSLSNRVKSQSDPTSLPNRLKSQSDPTSLPNRLKSQPDPTSLPNGAKSQPDPTPLPNRLKSQPDPTSLPNRTKPQPDPTSLPNRLKSQSDPTPLPNRLKSQPDPTSLPNRLKSQPDPTFLPNGAKSQSNPTSLPNRTNPQLDPTSLPSRAKSQSNPTSLPSRAKKSQSDPTSTPSGAKSRPVTGARTLPTAMKTKTSLMCSLDVTGPPDTVFHVVVVRLSCDERLSLTFSDRGAEHTPVDGCWTDMSPGPEFLTSSNQLDVFVTLASDVSLRKPLVVELSIVAAKRKELREEVFQRYVTRTMGFVQSPNFNTQFSGNHPRYTDTETQIRVPYDVIIMVSFVYFELYPRRYPHKMFAVLNIPWVEVSRQSQNGTEEMVWRGTFRESVPSAMIMDTRLLSVRFHSDVLINPGFRLLYTLHKPGALPVQTTDGQWNCNVSHWQDFRPHFACNLVTECAGQEDEKDCPYSRCRQEGVIVDDRCYFPVSIAPATSWTIAQKECWDHSGHLASLNSYKEWRKVRYLLLVKQDWNILFHIGVLSAPSSVSNLYRDVPRGDDGITAFVNLYTHYLGLPFCVAADSFSRHTKHTIDVCGFTYHRNISLLCEIPLPPETNNQKKKTKTLPKIPVMPNLTFAEITTTGSSYVTCFKGHVTHQFLFCDGTDYCWNCDDIAHERDRFPPFFRNMEAGHRSVDFECEDGFGSASYTLVCDHRFDCLDKSDEDFCVHDPCTVSQFPCGNKQCVDVGGICDKIDDCLDASDENMCLGKGQSASQVIRVVRERPPITVTFDIKGGFKVERRTLPAGRDDCEDTHFLCAEGALCLPVYVRCNDVLDCPDHGDEAACDSYTCPRMYRCRGSLICLHSTHVCDGLPHCPQHDDERFCDIDCPHNCTCYGLSFVVTDCLQSFEPHRTQTLRYLDASSTGLNPADLYENKMLVYLNLADCNLTHVHNLSLPNLQRLDLTNNQIKAILADDVSRVLNLRMLILTENPLQSLFVSEIGKSLSNLRVLNLSRVIIEELDVKLSLPFSQLSSLSLSDSGVQRVKAGGFQSLVSIKQLDLRGCPLTDFPRDVFRGLSNLQAVRADNYRLCCSATLPSGFDVNKCHAPFDEISSCESLLRSDSYRVFLVLLAVLALAGNFFSFFTRVLAVKKSGSSGHGVFVVNLCASDFLMGVYLVMIGVADRLYQGTYLWEDLTWRHSHACLTAGFLSLLSNEVSALIICLITVDRFLAIRFPFSQLSFSQRSSHLACLVVWTMGLVMAAVPLLPDTSWAFYSQSSICVPLPITRADFSGHLYAFYLMIVFNFVLFLLIAAGQASIYMAMASSMMTTDDVSRKSRELVVARRLLVVVLSDFLCWFPIGLTGLLASWGFPVPSEVNVAMAIFVLPLNSALNPFLYTLNMIKERRQRQREETLVRLVLRENHSASDR